MKSFCWLLVYSRNETCVRKVWVEVHGRTVSFYNYKGLAEDKFASHCVVRYSENPIWSEEHDIFSVLENSSEKA